MSRGWIMLLTVLLVLHAGRGVSLAERPGVVQDWLVAGYFETPDPNQLLQKPSVGDPATLAPSAGEPAAAKKWLKLHTHTGTVEFRDNPIVTIVDNSVVVAFVYVYSPSMQPAKLLMGLQYGGSVFLNGQMVLYLPGGTSLTPDAHRADVILGKGWNRLLVNVARYQAFRWQAGYGVRITDPDLKAIAGLKYSIENPYPGGKARMPEYAPHVSVYTVEQFGTHRVRAVNRTPIDLKNVELIVRSKAGRELLRKRLGLLKGHAHLEADIDVDEVFFQQNWPGATAAVRFDGGEVSARVEPMKLEEAYSVEYETPHIQRMKPWAAGRPNILLVTSGRSRQVVELIQRGDFEWHWVQTGDKEFGKRLREELSLYKFDCIVVAGQAWKKIPGRPLLEKLIDEGMGVVYVNPTDLSPTMGEYLGIDAAAAVEPYARAGALEKAADHPVVAGVPLAALPPIGPAGYKIDAERATVVAKVGDRAVVAVSEKGKRRAVLLNLGRGAELIWPMRREDILEPRLPVWERQWALVLKSIIWASKKEVRVLVQSTGPGKPVERTTIGDWGDAKLSVLVSTGLAPSSGTIEVTFRSRGYSPHVVEMTPFSLKRLSGQGPLPCIPYSLASGENVAEVVARNKDGKVLGWATCVFQIKPRATISKLAAEPAKDYYLPEDQLTFQVSGSADVAGLVLAGRLLDNRERVVWEQRRPLRKGAFTESFKLKPQGLLTPVARFQAEVFEATDKGKRACTEATGESIFFVRKELIWDSYEPVLWLTRGGVGWYYDVDYFKLLREVMWIPNGWCASFGPRSSAYYQMVYGGFNRVGYESLHFFSMNHNWTQATFEMRRRNFAKTKDIRWLYRTPVDAKTKLPVDKPDYANLPYGNNPHNSFLPLDDPEYLEWTTKKIASQIERVNLFNPIVYDLMDEGSYTSYARAFDFDFSPVSLKHFRIWLKQQHGSLDALNKEWATAFRTWDEVMPLHTEQARTRAKGRKLPSYAPWADHRRYNDIVYNKYIQHCSDAARAAGDGDAVVGIGGGQRPDPYGGWDYWLVTNHFTWIENYFADTNEYIRSFNTPDRRLKACPGTDVWYSVMTGNSGFYRWVDYGHIRGDFSLLPRGAVTARQLEEVRGRGFAKLLLVAEPVDDPVGIHYSQSTIRVSYIRGGRGAADEFGNGGPLIAKLGFYNLLEELGYQYKFVAYAQVEDGELAGKGYKLMILPESLALSDKEVAQLKAWVEAGGVLLCDRWTGEYTDHGRKLETSALQTAFGIDPKAPAEKKVGKGTVIYLASDFPCRYWHDRNPADVKPYWDRLKDVLKKAGLPEPRARMYAGESPARRTEIRYFQLGQIRYHAIGAEVAGSYRFVSAEPGYLYDMREGKAAGRTTAIEVKAEPEFPGLVAWSPYQIEAVQAAADKATVAGGQSVKISAQVKAAEKPGTHVLNFRVYGPEGQERRHYGNTLVAEGGAAALTFQTALNEAKGKWTVKVADLASGIVGEAAFEVN